MGKDFNFRLVAKIIGTLLFIEGLLLCSISIIPLIYHENDVYHFLISGGVTIAFAVPLFLLGLKAQPLLGKREGSVIVTFTWILCSAFGMLPFLLSGSIPSVTDAYFETMSGFTTTGASILNNIEELSHGILFWRSLTHWIGGLGIIVISLALLPLFGYNGMQLFAAESSGPTKDKIHPKINETAKRLFVIYIVLNVAETILLKFGGMSWFDAVCHSFSTTATGGFSTKQASIGYWNSPYIEYVVTIFMILSGVNFSLYYFAYKHKFEKIISNEELRYYLILLFSAAALIAVSRVDFSAHLTFNAIEKATRESVFYVASLMTTTGFVTVDYMEWQTYT
jgi:trk system potassium uptake protein TrkH